MYIYVKRQTDRHTYTSRDRQTDTRTRQETDRQTHVHVKRQTDRHTYTSRDRQTDTRTRQETDRQTHVHVKRQTDRQTDRETDRQTVSTIPLWCRLVYRCRRLLSSVWPYQPPPSSSPLLYTHIITGVHTMLETVKRQVNKNPTKFGEMRHI